MIHVISICQSPVVQLHQACDSAQSSPDSWTVHIFMSSWFTFRNRHITAIYHMYLDLIYLLASKTPSSSKICQPEKEERTWSQVCCKIGTSCTFSWKIGTICTFFFENWDICTFFLDNWDIYTFFLWISTSPSLSSLFLFNFLGPFWKGFFEFLKD